MGMDFLWWLGLAARGILLPPGWRCRGVAERLLRHGAVHANACFCPKSGPWADWTGICPLGPINENKPVTGLFGRFCGPLADPF